MKLPELPEVETIANDIRPFLAGRTITAVRVLKPDILRRIGRPAFIRGLTGAAVTAVVRRAKNIVIELADGRRLVIQPGMTGALLGRRARRSGEAGTSAPSRDPAPAVRAKAKRASGPAGVPPATAPRSRLPASAPEPPDQYVCVELGLDDGTVIRYRDVRRLGRVYLFTSAKWATHDKSIGPEPLDLGFTAEVMHGILRRSRVALKKAIMDQRRVAGVGNIYASEALWMARLDPSRPANTVNADEATRLREAIVDVLRRSIEGRGTTVRDYRTGTGEPGTFQGRLAVYDRAGEPCLRCGTRIAVTWALDARSTYFCWQCQHSPSRSRSPGRAPSRT